MRQFSKLNNRVTFYKKSDGGYMPGEAEFTEYYSCYAHIDNVWLKDLEIAKTNETLNDVTVTIRDTLGEYDIDNTMYFKIDGNKHKDKQFNIKSLT